MEDRPGAMLDETMAHPREALRAVTDGTHSVRGDA